jgi:hypothetical protein
MAVRSCVAVGATFSSDGQQSHPLAERWSGSSWARMPMPARPVNASRRDVSCRSTTSCVAVGVNTTSGGIGAPIVERWNGSRWRVQRVAPKIEDGELAGIACPTRDRCVAVGVNESDNTPLVIQF